MIKKTNDYKLFFYDKPSRLKKTHKYSFFFPIYMYITKIRDYII
jgi:hypothetical protein